MTSVNRNVRISTVNDLIEALREFDGESSIGAHFYTANENGTGNVGVGNVEFVTNIRGRGRPHIAFLVSDRRNPADRPYPIG